MPSGILIIDKPSGWTSMDVCAKIRGILHEKRVGHGGTLDPMATGVLPVFVGKATKAVEFADKSDKEYVAGMRLGIITNTQDVTGDVLETRTVSASDADVENTARSFIGDIEQIPPMYSAIKINGKKLCDLARKGKEVERPPRRVTISEIEILAHPSEDEYVLRVVCSKGTYIRTLCSDIGARLGCGAAMSSLRRTRAGSFSESESVTLDEVHRNGESLLRPVDSLFWDYPAFNISDGGDEARCRNGLPFPVKTDEGAYFRVFGQDGEFLCLSRVSGGYMTSVKNFFGA
ncbi:MAG: tRNA pseudouridine(55) synthase TruB [Oscillospiraceae bacterium]|nr:tRNA pseudouridine(55) synthase TruB [Oscillospiraceae bacterium]